MEAISLSTQSFPSQTTKSFFFSKETTVATTTSIQVNYTLDPRRFDPITIDNLLGDTYF